VVFRYVAEARLKLFPVVGGVVVVSSIEGMLGMFGALVGCLCGFFFASRAKVTQAPTWRIFYFVSGAEYFFS